MAYDAADDESVLFGGATGLFAFVDDTWGWDGSNRTELSPAHKPSARAKRRDGLRHPATEQLILFGGLTLNARTDRSKSQVTLGLERHRLGRTARRRPKTVGARSTTPRSPTTLQPNRLILFGGYTTAEHPLGDTWAWNGTDWRLTPPTNPSARSIAAMAYDAPREQVILFGGAGESPGALGETWAFGSPFRR